jgi:RND family efflux transporter MFP subunit
MMNSQPQSVEPPVSTVQPVAEKMPARLRDFQVAEHERRDSSKRRKRLLLWLIVLVILAGGSMTGYSYRNANNVPEADVFLYTGKPSKDVVLDLSGFVVPHTKIVISPQVGGIVSRVLIPEEGKKIKEGDLLFEVEDTRYKAEYLQAEAALGTAEAQLAELEHGSRKEEKEQAHALVKQAKATLALMTQEYNRDRGLYPGNIGLSEYEKSRKNYLEAIENLKVQEANAKLSDIGPRPERIDAARAEVKRARATYDRAKYFHEKTKIYAPDEKKGRYFTVLQRNVNPGESIQADLVYTALCTLADLTEMEAEVDVQERDLRLIAVGTPCEVIPDAYPDRIYRARLNRMQPLVNRQRGVVQVKVTIDKPDQFLLPDMNARVLFLKEASSNNPDRNLPRIPLKALVPQSDPPAVFVLESGVARLRTIQLGATVGDSSEVQDGLKAEDKVLLPASSPLRDGKPVRLRGQPKEDKIGQKDHK